jgi:hypothetical protein
MVMVGDQDVAERPARVGLEPSEYRFGITRVDDSAVLGAWVL